MVQWYPSFKVRLVCSSMSKALGPWVPPGPDKPSRLYLGDKPCYFHHFLPPIRQQQPHCRLPQLVHTHRHGSLDQDGTSLQKMCPSQGLTGKQSPYFQHDILPGVHSS